MYFTALFVSRSKNTDTFNFIATALHWTPVGPQLIH